MLSIFPELLFLAPFSALLLRTVLAGFLLYAAWNSFGSKDGYTQVAGIAAGLAGAALLGGAWTQPAAILAAFVVLSWLWHPSTSVYPRSTAFLALALCASLLVTGPGAFAFDLPL